MNYYYQIEGSLRNNIGDALQGMVAKQFLPPNAKPVDREALSHMPKESPGFLIANGWYLHDFACFPPPSNIAPLYIAVHVARADFLHSKAVREHFMQHAPIGCRDQKTLRLFLGWGIPAYYSGCLTVTVNQLIHPQLNSNDDVFLVDGIDHPIPQNIIEKIQSQLGKPCIHISHDPTETKGEFEEYCINAESAMLELLQRYARAKLVITTKIHCALPCIGMGCNVALIHPNPDDPRLETVREFIEIQGYAELGKAPLRQSKVDEFKLARRQRFLSEIVERSVSEGFNILARPKSVQHRILTIKSRALATIFSSTIKGLRFLPGVSKRVNKVFPVATPL